MLLVPTRPERLTDRCAGRHPAGDESRGGPLARAGRPAILLNVIEQPLCQGGDYTVAHALPDGEGNRATT